MTCAEKRKITDAKATALVRQILRDRFGIANYDVNKPEEGMNQLGRNHPFYDLACRKKGKAKFYVDVKGVAKKNTNWPVQERKPKPKEKIRYSRAKGRIATNPLLYILVCLETNAFFILTRAEQERIYTDYRNGPNPSKTDFLVVSRGELRRYGHKSNEWHKLLAVAEQERRQDGSQGGRRAA